MMIWYDMIWYDDMMFCTIFAGRSHCAHWLLPGQGIFGGRWKLLEWWWGVTRRGLRKERQQGPTAYPAVSCRCWRCWRCPPCHVFGKGWCPERQDKKTGGGYLKISISTSNNVTTCYNILHHVGHHAARSCNSSESSPQVSNANGILNTIEPYFSCFSRYFQMFMCHFNITWKFSPARWASQRSSALCGWPQLQPDGYQMVIRWSFLQSWS